jgi:hypothetical protein
MNADGLFSFKADALTAGTFAWFKEAGDTDIRWQPACSMAAA